MNQQQQQQQYNQLFRTYLSAVELLLCILWELKYTKRTILIIVHLLIVYVFGLSGCIALYLIGIGFWAIPFVSLKDHHHHHHHQNRSSSILLNSKCDPDDPNSDDGDDQRTRKKEIYIFRKAPEHILLSTLLNRWWKGNVVDLLERQIITSLMGYYGSKSSGMDISISIESLDVESVPVIQNLVISEPVCSSVAVHQSVCYADLIVSYETKTEFLVEINAKETTTTSSSEQRRQQENKKNIANVIISNVRLLTGVRFGFDFNDHSLSYSPQIHFSILPDRCSVKFTFSKLSIPMTTTYGGVLEKLASKIIMKNNDNIQQTLDKIIQSFIRESPISWPSKKSICKPVKVNAETMNLLKNKNNNKGDGDDNPSADETTKCPDEDNNNSSSSNSHHAFSPNITISDIQFVVYKRYEDLIDHPEYQQRYRNYTFVPVYVGSSASQTQIVKNGDSYYAAAAAAAATTTTTHTTNNDDDYHNKTTKVLDGNGSDFYDDGFHIVDRNFEGRLMKGFTSTPLNFTNERGLFLCLTVKYGSDSCVNKIDTSNFKYIQNVIEIYSSDAIAYSHSNMEIKYSRFAPLTTTTTINNNNTNTTTITPSSFDDRENVSPSTAVVGIRNIFMFHKSKLSELQKMDCLRGYSFLGFETLKFTTWNLSPRVKDYFLAYK